MSDLTFASYLQGPLGEAIETPENMGTLPAPAFAPSVTLVGPATERVSIQGPHMRLLGPGDVEGLPAGTIVRNEPSPGAVDVEPNYLASVEVVPIELPWVLTPARAAAGRLRPWMVLIVVEATKTPLVPGNPLPTIRPDVDELPDLRDSWGWVHVQRSTGTGDLPGGGRASRAATARLICPRRLSAGITYRACVVPAFGSGVAAGLGDSKAHEAPNAPAWSVDAGGSVLLPVYHEWSFTTGMGGDFEQLVTRLRPADLESLPMSSTRPVDIRAPWPADVPLAETAQIVGVQGALCPFSDPPVPEPTAAESTLSAFTTTIRRQLDAPAQRLQGSPPDDATGSLAPPLYGGRHVAQDLVEGDPAWLAELNTSVAHRVAAGLGAEYVRTNQEMLMARAWEQVGAIREANRRRSVVALTTEVAAKLHAKHLAPLLPGELLALAGPVGTRTRTAPATTLSTEMRMSMLVDGAAGTAFARRVRPGGKLSRRTGVTVAGIVPRALAGEITVPAGAPVIPLSPTIDDAAIPLVSSRAAAGQLVVMSAMARVAEINSDNVGGDLLNSRIGGMGLSDLVMTSIRAGDVSAVASGITEQVAGVTAATTKVLTDMTQDAATFGSVSEFGVRIQADALAGRLADALRPDDSHWTRLASQTSLPDWIIPPPTGDPVMACPEFPIPTALTLLASDPEWFLPGLGALPMNRVMLLQQNGPFIESYLVGLNHEMMRELLWREYPTDRRGTPFTHFWPRPDGTADIPPIHTWTDPSALGKRLLQNDSLSIVLVRGDVLRRYPEMVVTAVRSGPPELQGRHRPDPAQQPLIPTFVIKVDESTTAYAFDIPVAQLRTPASAAAPGWFFVLSEHGFRVRFGFDEAGQTDVADPFPSWNAATWPSGDDAPTPATVPVRRGHAMAGMAFGPPSELPAGEPTWNRDAADIARIALQRPFRVAIQADVLLHPTPGDI